jgi:C4-type Zn-finger protein
MARKTKAPKKAKIAEPKCGVCEGAMKLKSVIPAAHIFPELKTYQCADCGNRRTVEDVAELTTPEVVAVAA